MRYTLLLALGGLVVAGCNDTSPPLSPSDAAPVFSAGTAVVHRPLEDFHATSRDCPVAWWDPSQPNMTAVIDFWDFFHNWYPDVPLGTTYTGWVKERPLADGTAEITVRVHVKNAFTGARLLTETGPGPAVFGYLSREVAAGSPPVLGQGTFSITYINTAPGAPLPDFCDVIFSEENTWQVSKIHATGSATGPLRATFGVPEGTPGRLNLVEVYRELTQAGSEVAKGHINLRPIGQ